MDVTIWGVHVSLDRPPFCTEVGRESLFVDFDFSRLALPVFLSFSKATRAKQMSSHVCCLQTSFSSSPSAVVIAAYGFLVFFNAEERKIRWGSRLLGLLLPCLYGGKSFFSFSRPTCLAVTHTRDHVDRLKLKKDFFPAINHVCLDGDLLAPFALLT